jgi:ribonuclease Y
MSIEQLILWVVLGAIFFFAGWKISTHIGHNRVANANEAARRIIGDAKKEAETLRKEMILEAKDEQLKLKEKHDREVQNKEKELAKLERSLRDKELNMNRRSDLVDHREKDLKVLERNIFEREKMLKVKDEKLSKLIAEENQKLENIARMTTEEAIQQLKANLVDKAKQQAAEAIKEIRDTAQLQANREAREIIINAIQRSAADHSVETTVSVVNLPNDEIKGRIIGREGRNIRAFEQATGVEIIVDDTPEAVILSGFDPYRREVARLALEKLTGDGRIHPGRIEEIVKKCEKELEEVVALAGEQAMMETGVLGLHPELQKYLGRLKFRTSYGQNVLQHSIEVAHLAGLMAAELGLDASLSKRAGLLHDIGKAIDRTTEGTHAKIGADLVKKYREGKVVQNACAAHHEDVEYTSLISVLVQAADAISSSRPGARRETLEGYVKRLNQLEEVATSFAGVSKSFAIQAGREMRVMVEHDKVSDAEADQLASDIAAKIQEEVEYPGQIRITVIREFRAVDYAK